MQQHEVVFTVHHQRLVNHLAFELVASVVVFAVVLDLVSTPDAHVLVPVLVHLVSPVVLVLDEIVVVLEPFVIAVFVIATRTVVAHCCFCGGDSVGGCCCVRSCCLGTPCLERSSGSSPPILISLSRISRSAGDAIRSCSVAHLIAVA